MDNQNQTSDDEIDALVKTYGSKYKTAPKSESQSGSSSAPAVTAPQSKASAPADDDEAQIDALVSTYGSKYNEKKAATEEPPPEAEKQISEEEKKYRQQIEEYMPQAREEAKGQGKLGSFLSGLGRDPIIGQNVLGAMYDVEALFRGKGDTYAERRRDLGAREEAAQRAAGELNPWTQFAGEMTAAMALPMGRAAEGLNAIKAPVTKAGKWLLNTIGYGAEGAGYGAATAISEKAGTKPESETSDVGEAALFGGGLGAAGPTIGAGLSKLGEAVIPDWVRYMGKDSLMKGLVSKIGEDEADGTLKMSLNEAIERTNNGEKINPLDVVGPKGYKFLADRFRGRSDALEGFSNQFQQRLEGGADRFDKALREAAGIEGEFNQDQLKTEAEELRKRLNNEAYTEARDPSNGVGTWKNSWEKYLTDKNVIDAVNATNEEAKQIFGNRFASPIGREGSKDITTLNIATDLVNELRNKGISKIDDLANLGEQGIKNLFVQEDPQAVNRLLKEKLGIGDDFIAMMSDEQKAQILKAEKLKAPKEFTYGSFDDLNKVRNIMDSLKGVNPDRLTLLRPDMVNVRYLDNLQRHLTMQIEGLGRNPSFNMDIMNKLKGIREDIVNSMKGPRILDSEGNFINNKFFNPNTYNEAFDKAHTQTRQLSYQKDAFDLGRQFLKNLNDGLKTSEIANAVPNMTEAEQKYFIQGIFGQMKTLASTKGDGILEYNKLQKWFGNNDVSNALRDALGQPKFDRLQAYVKGEAIMNESLKDATNLQNLRKSDVTRRLSKDILALGVSYLIESKAPLTYLIYNEILSPYMGKRLANKLRGQLESRDINQIMDVYDKLMKNKTTRQPFLDAIRKAVIVTMVSGNHPSVQDIANSAAGVVLPFLPQETPQYKKGGRVERATGGRIPDADKVFKAAKRDLDRMSKPMMHVHDDEIVKALRILKGVV